MKICLFLFIVLFTAGYYFYVSKYMTNRKDDHFRTFVFKTDSPTRGTILTHDAEVRFNNELTKSPHAFQSQIIQTNNTRVEVTPSLKVTARPIPESVLNFTLLIPNSEKAVCSDCFILHMGQRIPYNRR